MHIHISDVTQGAVKLTGLTPTFDKETKWKRNVVNKSRGLRVPTTTIYSVQYVLIKGIQAILDSFH